MIKNENFEIIWGPRIQDINVTKCTASWDTTPTAGSKPCVEGSVLTTQVPLVDSF